MAKNKSIANQVGSKSCEECGEQAAVDKFRGKHLCRRCLIGKEDNVPISLMTSSIGQMICEKDYKRPEKSKFNAGTLNRHIKKKFEEFGWDLGQWNNGY